MATVYISPTGNDSTGTGTSGNPWLTISKAYSNTVSGDTIRCLAGISTYTWASQTFTSDRIIVGDSAAGCVFDGGGASIDWHASNVLSVSNLTFRNGKPSGSFNSIIGQSAASSAFSFTNCIFNSIICDLGGSAILGNYIGSGAISCGSLTLLSCLFQNCTKNGSGLGSGALIQMASATSMAVVIHNCTCYSNIAAADTLQFLDNSTPGTITVEMKNNIIWNANGTPKTWFVFGDATSYTGSNNDILGYSNAPSLSNQLSTDPLFVDATNSNFNLRPTSPCIDTGVVI